MADEVVIKTVVRQWVATRREVIPAYSEVSKLIGEVVRRLGPAAGSSFLPVAIWHDVGYKASDVDAEAGCLLKNQVTAVDGLKIYELPETTAASVTHHGAYRDLPKAYGKLMDWLAANGYQPSGPARELYLHCSEPIRQDDESYVTEIQMPVSK